MKIFVGLLLLILMILTPFLSRVLNARKQGKVLMRLILLVKANKNLLKEIGSIKTTGVTSYYVDLNLGKAEIHMELIGEKKTRTIHVCASKTQRNPWAIDRIE